uniref:Uncharacterized protein n=1 Tax=Steinernema glaseri TaxID=37863 RepID=A0A1I7YCV5_9BILA
MPLLDYYLATSVHYALGQYDQQVSTYNDRQSASQSFKTERSKNEEEEEDARLMDGSAWELCNNEDGGGKLSMPALERHGQREDPNPRIRNALNLPFRYD